MKCPSCGADVYPKSYLSHEIDGVPRSQRYLVFASIFVVEMTVTLFDLIVRKERFTPIDYGVVLNVAFGESLGIALAVFTLSYYGSLIAERQKRFKALYSIAFVVYILMLIGMHKSSR